jgi:iron complex transport system ATP-binding protein
LVNRNFVSLSDGEQQKVMIAKALVQDTPLIFMDEPAAFLDYPSKIELVNIMHKLSREKHKTILFSSHDLDLLLRHTDQMWVMAPQQPLRQGTPKELVDQGIIDEYFKPIVAKKEFFWLAQCPN